MLRKLHPRTLKKFFCELRSYLRDPSWSALTRSMGCDDIQERPIRFTATSRKHAEDHDLVWLHNLSGLSCLFFVIPSFVYIFLIGGGYVAEEVTMSVGVALALNVFLVYVSIVSFAADYWYTGEKPGSPGREVPEFQKQIICNTIDHANVPFIATSEIILGGVQLCLAPGLNWVIPVLAWIFGMGVYAKQVSNRYNWKFITLVSAPGYDSKNPTVEARNALSWGLFYHIAWHTLAVVAPIVQTYGLLMYGIVAPRWMSC